MNCEPPGGHATFCIYKEKPLREVKEKKTRDPTGSNHLRGSVPPTMMSRDAEEIHSGRLTLQQTRSSMDRTFSGATGAELLEHPKPSCLPNRKTRFHLTPASFSNHESAFFCCEGSSDPNANMEMRMRTCRGQARPSS